MKVLYMSGMYPTPTYPQKGIFCHEQVKALRKLGIEVDVIVPMTIYDKEYTTKMWEYEGVKIHYIRYFKLPGVHCFENIGKHLYHALMRAKIDFTQYDVLHADAPLPAGNAIQRISARYKIPFVVHGHGLDVFMDVDYKNAPNCDRIVTKCKEVYLKANAIVGVSQKVLDNILSRLDVKDKCFVVYNGVDTNKFFPDYDKSNDILEIITVGNLIELKGHDITLQAIAKVVNQGYNKLHLTIYGRGEKEEELKQLTQKLKLEKYVTFEGYVPYEEIAKKMREADLFVLPSWYEAIGCVYLEAMASGTVTVGCYENGIDEVIRTGQNGFLVRPHNIQDLVNVVLYANEYKMHKKYQRIAQNARKSVEEGYSWYCSAKSLIAVYRTIKANR